MPRILLSRYVLTAVMALAMLSIGAAALAQSETTSDSDYFDRALSNRANLATDAASGPNPIGDFITSGPEKWTSPGGMHSTMQVMLLLTILSLAPALLLMTTSFVRIIVVMGLLRQAIGAQGLPPSQVVTAISLFMTLLLMGPTWSEVYTQSILPYSQEKIGLEEAWNRGCSPVREFMSRQIEAAGNSDDVWLFYEYLPPSQKKAEPETYDDVPLQALLPAFMLSELKVAFLIGFQIYLPFLVLDIVVSSITISMGMMMLPPAMVSLPFKLLLFVMVDGWTLIVGMLMESFAMGGG